MEIKALRTDEEIKEYIAKNYGSYEAYHEGRLKDPAPTAPKPIKKSASEISADYYQAIAKARGITLEKFFALYPKEYDAYRELATSRDY